MGIPPPGPSAALTQEQADTISYPPARFPNARAVSRTDTLRPGEIVTPGARDGAVCAELNAVVKRILAEQEKAKTQFKPGASPNPGGKPKAQARMDSCEPEKRDHKTEHARSTVGQVAAAAGASHHKAAQGVALAGLFKR